MAKNKKPDGIRDQVDYSSGDPSTESPSNEDYTYSLLAQLVKNPPTVLETPLRFLGWEDPLEEGMATRPRILAWKSPWTKEPGGAKSQTGLSN